MLVGHKHLHIVGFMDYKKGDFISMKKDTWSKYIDDDKISEEDEDQFMREELERLKEKKENSDHKDK